MGDFPNPDRFKEILSGFDLLSFPKVSQGAVSGLSGATCVGDNGSADSSPDTCLCNADSCGCTCDACTNNQGVPGMDSGSLRLALSEESWGLPFSCGFVYANPMTSGPAILSLAMLQPRTLAVLIAECLQKKLVGLIEAAARFPYPCR